MARRRRVKVVLSVVDFIVYVCVCVFVCVVVFGSTEMVGGTGGE